MNEEQERNVHNSLSVNKAHPLTKFMKICSNCRHFLAPYHDTILPHKKKAFKITMATEPIQNIQ